MDPAVKTIYDEIFLAEGNKLANILNSRLKYVPPYNTRLDVVLQLITDLGNLDIWMFWRELMLLRDKWNPQPPSPSQK